MKNFDEAQRQRDLELIRDSWPTLRNSASTILADKPPLPGQGYPIYSLANAQFEEPII